VRRARRDHGRRSLANLRANTIQHGGAAALFHAKDLVEMNDVLTDVLCTGRDNTTSWQLVAV